MIRVRMLVEYAIGFGDLLSQIVHVHIYISLMLYTKGYEEPLTSHHCLVNTWPNKHNLQLFIFRLSKWTLECSPSCRTCTASCATLREWQMSAHSPYPDGAGTPACGSCTYDMCTAHPEVETLENSQICERLFFHYESIMNRDVQLWSEMNYRSCQCHAAHSTSICG
jgi:hypothetical protein